MDTNQLRQILNSVAGKKTTVESAIEELRQWPFEQTADATIDHHRAIRCGHPEVIFCQGKTVDQVVRIAGHLAAKGQQVLGTRASKEQITALKKSFKKIEVCELGRAVLVNHKPASVEASGPYVAVVCAGTADLPVVEEACMTLKSMHVPMQKLTDVGVAGIHRLLSHTKVLQGACAVIVAAGMEGALPSVVGGLVGCPVYAVPTSVGYGVSMNGLAALLAMLNSCASNVSVVNIDNGFGAAFSASLVYQQIARHSSKAK